MKISVQQYALSLYESLLGKSDKETKAVLKNFVIALAGQRALSRAEEIITAFSALWDKEHGELTAELTSARKLPAAAKDNIKHYLQERTGAKKIELSEREDKALLGGFVLRYNSRIVDGSLKTTLNDLENKISA